MLLLVKNKNGELETRDMPDTFPTREAAQDQMLAIVDMRNQLEQEALGW